MQQETLEPPPVLAANLIQRLEPLLATLGWQYDDLALDIFRTAESLAECTVAACGRLAPDVRDRYRHRALAAAHHLENRLDLLHRVVQPAVDESLRVRKLLSGLVRALAPAPT
jgi:hypothetical protein